MLGGFTLHLLLLSCNMYVSLLLQLSHRIAGLYFGDTFTILPPNTRSVHKTKSVARVEGFIWLIFITSEAGWVLGM